MSGRIIAQLLVSGGQVLLRAMATAYSRALVSASPAPPPTPAPRSLPVRRSSRHADRWRAPSPFNPSPRARRSPTVSPSLPFTPRFPSLTPDAQRSGVAQEAAKGGAASSMFAKKTMAPEEARMILGVEAGSSAEEVAARYAKMFEANEKNGSFYLQSKIHRAKEALDADMLGEEGKGKGGAGEGGAGSGSGSGSGDEKNPNAGRGFAASASAEEKR